MKVDIGMVKFYSGVASLQERIPSDYVSICKLGKKLLERNTSEDEQGEIAIARILQALGGSILKFGAGDMRCLDGFVHGGNFLVHSEQLASEGLIYAVDLIGFSRMRQFIARSVLKVAV